MPAFGLNRFTQAFAVAVNDAGERISDRRAACVNRLADRLFAWGGRVSLEITFRFVYPFVGPGAVANSFNLADPSIGRIEWEGGVTHSTNGATGDGASGVGKTGVTIAGSTQGDAFVTFGVYSRTASTGTFVEASNWSGPATGGLLIYARQGDGNAYVYMGTIAAFWAAVNSQGLFTGLRTSATGHVGYRNGVAIATATGANFAVHPPVPFVLLASPVPATDPQTYNQWSNRNLAFAFLSNKVGSAGIGAIFSTAKQAELYTIVQGFQGNMLRQV